MPSDRIKSFFSGLLLSVAVSFAIPETAHCEPTGKEMWEVRCSACHSIDPPPKLAPPVRGIVMNYRRTYSDREAFAQAVSAFAHSPTKEASQMPHALEKFNLMPALPFEKNELAEIARWMWDTIVTPGTSPANP